MAYTPSTNVDPTKAALNEQSPGVLALQQSINKANAGVAGYVPLVEDSKYGPKTAAAAATYKPTTTPTTPTVGDVYGAISGAQTDPNLSKAEKDLETFNSNAAGQISNVDEGAVRAQTLKNFQGEIDATNALFAEKLNAARIAGAGRLGNSTSIQARRGLIGSDFGSAETDTVNTGNRDIEAGIEAEKAAALSKIFSKSNEDATKAIADKTKAIEGGLTSHLQNLKDAATNKTNTATKIAQIIYDHKLDPSSMPNDQLLTAINGKNGAPYGVTVDDVKNAFVGVKKTAEDTARKNAEEANKALPASAQEYEYAKKNGYKGTYNQYQTEDANRKALANRSGATVSERNQSTVNKISTLFSPGYTIPGTKGVPYIDGANGYATPEGWKTAIQASGLTRPDFIKAFGYLVAPQLEPKYGLTPAEVKLITGALPSTD